MTIRRNADNFSTLLTNSITNSQTSFDLDSVTGFPSLAGSAEVLITIDDGVNIEKCVVTGSITGTTLNTVARGQDGSSAFAFAAGTPVEIRPLASSVDRKADLPSADGIICRIAAETTLNRTLTGTTNQITITNGDGVSGNPTAAIADNATFPGTNGNTLAQGSTASRPAAGTFGRLRPNTSTGFLEFDDSSAWNPLPKAPNVTITALSVPTWSATNTPTLINNSGVTISSNIITCSGINLGNETFDQYDEGTWTPVWTFATLGDLSVSYSTQLGVYRRIGDMTFLGVVLIATPTYTTSAGALEITGMPFNSNTTLTGSPCVEGSNCTWTAGRTVAALRCNTAGVLNVAGMGSASAVTNFSVTNFPTGLAQNIRGTLSYPI